MDKHVQTKIKAFGIDCSLSLTARHKLFTCSHGLHYMTYKPGLTKIMIFLKKYKKSDFFDLN